MRILVVAAPGVGHLLPMLPLARAARARGHEVRIASGSSLAPIAAAAGFPFLEVGPPTIDSVAGSIPGIQEATGRRRALLIFREVFCGPIAAEQAEGLRQAAADWRPDLIVREDMAFAGWLAANHLGIQQATVQVTAWRPRMRDLAVEPLGRLRERYDLSPDPDLATLYGACLLLTRPPSLRDPAAAVPDIATELRPIADDRYDGTDDLLDLPDAGGRPRVAVTLGTVNSRRHDLLRPIIEGVHAAGAQVVVALGDDPAALGEVPPGTVVRRFLPMSGLLPLVDAVVFHGGSGTMTAALAAGRPVVVVPIAADQPDNADQCAASGVGVVVELADLTATAIQTATTTVLRDPRFRRRAGEVAAEIVTMPGPDAAVERLERMVTATAG